MREVAKKLEEVLSPRKKALQIGQPIQNSPNVGNQRYFKIFEAKMVGGEEVNFKQITVLQGLRCCEISTEYLVTDDAGHYMRKKVIDIDRLISVFGVEIWKVQEVLKIYMNLSTFLPEVYFAFVQKRDLVLYVTHLR